jgi:hypothetical protein
MQTCQALYAASVVTAGFIALVRSPQGPDVLCDTETTPWPD